MLHINFKKFKIFAGRLSQGSIKICRCMY